MEILNLPFPLFASLDEVLRGFISPLGLVVFWALVSSIISMLLYWLVSSQESISRVSSQAAKARRDLARYDGEFAGIRPLVTKTLSLSTKQLRLTAGPALIASVPLLSLLAWLSVEYDRSFAEPGSTIEVRAYPEGLNLRWEPAAERGSQGGVWRISWPPPGQAVRLLDAEGREILALPPSAPVQVIHKWRWWNIILGNPVGYIPEESALDRIEVDLPKTTYVEFGPGWVRSWEATFFFVLVLSSLAIKIAFRIR